jgi:hypothetical protein
VSARFAKMASMRGVVLTTKFDLRPGMIGMKAMWRVALRGETSIYCDKAVLAAQSRGPQEDGFKAHSRRTPGRSVSWRERFSRADLKTSTFFSRPEAGLSDRQWAPDRECGERSI